MWIYQPQSPRRYLGELGAKVLVVMFIFTWVFVDFWAAAGITLAGLFLLIHLLRPRAHDENSHADV